MNPIPLCPASHPPVFGTQSEARHVPIPLGDVYAPSLAEGRIGERFNTQSGAIFKKTFEGDDAGKGREPSIVMPA